MLRKWEASEREREAAIIELERERARSKADKQDQEERIAALEKAQSRPTVAMAPAPERSGLWAFLSTKAGQGLVLGLVAVLFGGGGAMGAELWGPSKALQKQLTEAESERKALKSWAEQYQECQAAREGIWQRALSSGVDARFRIIGAHPGSRDVELISEKMGLVGIQPEEKPTYRFSRELRPCPKPP